MNRWSSRESLTDEGMTRRATEIRPTDVDVPAVSKLNRNPIRRCRDSFWNFDFGLETPKSRTRIPWSVTRVRTTKDVDLAAVHKGREVPHPGRRPK